MKIKNIPILIIAVFSISQNIAGDKERKEADDTAVNVMTFHATNIYKGPYYAKASFPNIYTEQAFKRKIYKPYNVYDALDLGFGAVIGGAIALMAKSVYKDISDFAATAIGSTLGLFTSYGIKTFIRNKSFKKEESKAIFFKKNDQVTPINCLKDNFYFSAMLYLHDLDIASKKNLEVIKEVSDSISCNYSEETHIENNKKIEKAFESNPYTRKVLLGLYGQHQYATKEIKKPFTGYGYIKEGFLDAVSYHSGGESIHPLLSKETFEELKKKNEFNRNLIIDERSSIATYKHASL